MLCVVANSGGRLHIKIGSEDLRVEIVKTFGDLFADNLSKIRRFGNLEKLATEEAIWKL